MLTLVYSLSPFLPYIICSIFTLFIYFGGTFYMFLRYFQLMPWQRPETAVVVDDGDDLIDSGSATSRDAELTIGRRLTVAAMHHH